MEFYFPDEDVFVSQFTNVQSGEDTTSFSDSRFKLFFEIPFYAFNNKVGGEITLPEAGLQQYAGSYEMNGRSVNITLEKNNLYFNLGGQFKLHPLSPTRFFLTGIKDPVWIDFTNDKLSVYQKGTYEWKKTK
jgi:hypothetical protein